MFNREICLHFLPYSKFMFTMTYILTNIQKTTTGGVTSRITKIVSHPSYVAKTADNDVSLWQLTTPIQASVNSSAIGFATLPLQDSDPAADSVATVSGWGLTSEDGTKLPTDLLKVSIPVIDRATCSTDYAAVSSSGCSTTSSTWEI